MAEGLVLLIGVIVFLLVVAALCYRFPKTAAHVTRAVADVEVDWCSESRGPLRW